MTSTVSNLKRTSLSFELRDDVEEVRKEWDDLDRNNVFLSSDYLKALQAEPPKGLKPLYMTAKDESGSPIAKIYFQFKRINLEESLKIDSDDKCPSFFNALSHYTKKFLAAQFDFYTLVLGNLSLSGNHAYFISNQCIESKSNLLSDAVDVVMDDLSEKGFNVPVIIAKDFDEEERFKRDDGTKGSFYEFVIQPSMILHLRKSWQTMDDYLGDMQSKYRTRYKRARKKFSGIEKRMLSLEDIESQKDRMYDLYLSVAGNAGFNLLSLNQNYFVSLKKELKEGFQVRGYYIDGNLISYCSTIDNGSEMEANFLGYETAENHKHQLYLNMLYDMIEDSILGGHETLNFSRTALEIKSSVGAEPLELFCYIRHTKTVQNRLLPNLFEFLKPTEVWTQRKPFKEYPLA